MNAVSPRSAGDPRAPRALLICTPARIAHPLRACTHILPENARRAPFPGPATPRTAHRLAPRTPSPRVHTRGSLGHLHASPGPALHAHPSRAQRPACPRCPGPASHLLPSSRVGSPTLRSPNILGVPAAWVLGFQEMPRVAPHCQEALGDQGDPRPLLSPAWVGSCPGSLYQPLMPLHFGRGRLPVSRPWGCRFGLKVGGTGANWGTWTQACGWRIPEPALLVTPLPWAAEGLGAPPPATEATLPTKHLASLHPGISTSSRS